MDRGDFLSGTEAYYRHATSHYQGYAGSTGGWHYGVWDDKVKNRRESLFRGGELLVEGLALGPESHVLDAGCGSGALAIRLARETGCRVTGITICPEHITLAQESAVRSGAQDKASFLVRDMNQTGFESDTFDLVLNEETYCYAFPKRRYLGEVLRILRPGGHWRALAMNLKEGSLSEQEESRYKVVRDGFWIPQLPTFSKNLEILGELGFEQVRADDLTDQAAPSARYIRRSCVIPQILMRFGLDWMIFSRNHSVRKSLRGHFLAGDAYSRGLLSGLFRQGLYSAMKPLG